MNLLRKVSALALVAVVSGTAANAYTLKQAAKPAEVPPASYRGDVYVDSRGCAYVRANIGSTVNWVPRLSSDRKTVICGLTPTASVTGMASARPPAPPAPPAPTAAPAQPAPATTAAAPKPAPATSIARTMKVTCPADGSTARVRIGSDTVAVNCAAGQTTAKSYIVQHAGGERTRLIVNPAASRPATPKAVAEASGPRAAQPAGSTARVRIGGVAPGSGSEAAGGGYPFGSGFGLGSGPGVADPVPTPGQQTLRGGTATTTTGGAAAAPEPRQVVIPAGYRSAWTDDRLNPERGPRSAYGDQQMAATWDTSKVPMREANPAPARGLIGGSDTGGVQVFTKSPSAVPATVARTPAAAPTKRYVQVGAFNVAANAERAVARLQALGLPGRVAKTRSGRTVVVAGPYAEASALNSALAIARRGGFADAFLRN